MNRRGFVQACGFVAGLRTGGGYAQSGPMRRIGFLGLSTDARTAARLVVLRRGLARFGFVEGKNLVIEARFGGDNYARLAELAAELATLKVEVIVTHGTPGAQAAKRWGGGIPVVTATVGDPVMSGLTTNLREPDGNVTGSSFFVAELATKRLEVLRDLLPDIKRVAVLQNPGNLATMPIFKSMQQVAMALKLDLQQVGARGPGEFDTAFTAMAKARAEALVMVEDVALDGRRKAIAELALARHLPAIGSPEFADVGGLIAYGVDLNALWERAAHFVDRLLKGAKVTELPIERATKFELVVNNQTARALKIAIPHLIAVRADRVIE